MSMYYKRYEFQRRFSIFYMASIVAAAFGGVSAPSVITEQH